MTREMGKPLTETRGDVQEGIDTAYYAATEGRRLFGHTVPSELREQVGDELPPADRRRAASSRRSTSRWRFRRGRCSRRCSAETRASSSRPRTCRTPGTLLVEILLEAGLPPEVIQLVHGVGEDVGAAIVEPSATFRSSRSRDRPRRARIVGETCGRMHKRLSLEMGGKNAHDRARRRRSRSRARGRALGRVRHDGPALHGDEPADPAGRDSRRVPRAGSSIARRRSSSATGARRAPTSARSSTRPSLREGRALRRHRAGGGRGSGAAAAQRADGQGLDNGYFFEPTIFARVRAGHAARAGGDLRPGALGHSRPRRRRGVRGQQRREVRTVVVGLHARRERRVPGAERARQRHHVHQRADDRRRGTSAVRRRKADGQRPPRRRLGSLRVLLGDEGRLSSISRARCSARRSTTTSARRTDCVARRVL